MLEILSEEKFLKKCKNIFFFTDMKDMKINGPGPYVVGLVLHITCSVSYLSFWPAGLD